MDNTVLNQSLTLPTGAILKNRIAKSALSEGIAEANGRPSEALFNLYEQWGKGGAGLLISGNVMVNIATPMGPFGNGPLPYLFNVNTPRSNWAIPATNTINQP